MPIALDLGSSDAPAMLTSARHIELRLTGAAANLLDFLCVADGVKLAERHIVLPVLLQLLDGLVVLADDARALRVGTHVIRPDVKLSTIVDALFLHAASNGVTPAAVGGEPVEGLRDALSSPSRRIQQRIMQELRRRRGLEA